MARIGLISDTHSLVRPEALASLRGTDLIIHAGDIGGATVLDELRAIAPVAAVRGNNDRGNWAEGISNTEWLTVDGQLIYVIHDLAEIDIDPQSAGVRLVVSGHTHKPKIEEQDGVLFVNPGSAGPRRFNLPITAAIVEVTNGALSATITSLERGSGAP